MSRESRQRMRREAERRHVHAVRRRRLFRVLLFAGIVLIVASAMTLLCLRRLHNIAARIQLVSFTQPRTLKALLALPSSELEHCDIARMNLLCAEGLPGAKNVNVNQDCAVLDSWARHIKSVIDRNFQDYWENPGYFHHSTNFYKMAMMARVLYEDYRIRYDPNRMVTPGSERPDDDFFVDANDIFIQGLITGNHRGTCSSMPVLYVALGRRLGFPLKLVTTRQHLFIRWDSPAEKFDMDATSKGNGAYLSFSVFHCVEQDAAFGAAEGFDILTARRF